MKRKFFLKSIALTGMGSIALPSFSNNFQDEPQLDKALVQTFVGSAHRDMDKVKSMLEAHPNLINAAHDWKMGDFETALGAASHVGYKELAQYLLDNGAQANIFTACLFGKMEIIKPMLAAFPNTLHAKGPHGYTLLHHAQKGGDGALEVKEYLESLGAKETQVPIY